MNSKISISTQKRHLRNGTQTDDLTYHYLLENGKLVRNRLYHVNDAIAGATYVGDLEDQGTIINTSQEDFETLNNYKYDAEGRLIQDKAEGIEEIVWRVDGKVKKVIFEDIGAGSKNNLEFDYDAFGRRIAKHVLSQSHVLVKSTYYVLDAQGNQLLTYEHIPEDSTSLYQLAERVIYGSSRLGINTNKVDMLDENPEEIISLTLGNKLYEMSNHLGNVLTVINDIKVPQATNSVDVDGYLATIVSTADYSPFGVQLDGRTESAESYRYGFNSMEKDDEMKGAGNSINYEFRFHDSRIGRFMSVDDLTSSYPWYTPYQFAGNKPIWAIDLDGLEEYVMHYRFEDGKVTHLKTIKNSEVTMKLSGYKRVRGADVPQYRANHTDTRTGQPMSPSEIGMVQYQYYDADGNRLNIRREFSGKFVEGDNEMMTHKKNNLFGSIYIGPFNPTVTVEGKEVGDYRREPQDEVDQAAMLHDMLYDAVDAAGFEGAVIMKKTIPADKVLVTLAENTKKKAETNQCDNVTGKQITNSTLIRAKAVSLAFKLILSNKDK